MREPERTPEALHDMRTQDELTAEEFAKELRACVYAAIAAIFFFLGAQYLWVL